MHPPCPCCEETTLALLDRLGRVRALKEDESVLLERTLKRQTERLRYHNAIETRLTIWTRAMDAELLRLSSPSQKREFAQRHGVSMSAIRGRMLRLNRTGEKSAGRG